jgi:flagellar hook-associated protein 1 FlgK
MADFLSVGISGLLAAQTALATTAHNVSNLNTPGYSRQRADLATRVPQPTGSGFLGNGVNVVNVRRVYDQFATEQVRSHTAQNSRLAAYYDLASQVDNLLADPDAGLAPALQNFFDASQGVADNPSSIPARQVFISEANALVERFGTIDQRLTSLRDSVGTRLQNLVTQINSLAQSLGKVNRDITMAGGNVTGQPPNDLLDRRDELLRELSELVPVTTLEQDDGAINVFIGNGQTLVIGSQARGISTMPNPYNSHRLEIAMGTDGKGPIISDFITGGELGGVLEFRRDILEPTENSLGRVALGIAEAMNEQHAQGLDLNNALGKQFFALRGLPGNPKDALPASTNASTSTVAFTVTDTSALTTSDYTVSTQDGVNFSVMRVSDGKAVGSFAFPGPSTPIDGLQFTIDAPAAPGDTFLVEPTRTAASDIKMLISNVKDIAAAAPLRGEQTVGNLGTGEITNPDVSSGTNLPAVLAAAEVTLRFDPNANGPGNPGFVVEGGTAGAGNPLGAGVLAYDPAVDSNGASFDLGAALGVADYNGITFTVSGTPLSGDTFTVGKNNDASGDNRNALKIAGLQDAALLDGGTTNLQTAYGQLVSGVGAQTHQLDVNSRAQQTILDQAIQAREEIAGVNMDEEAANLIRFQQSYQAAAQVIRAADTMFQTVLDAVRR